jgi:hypothetical protein
MYIRTSFPAFGIWIAALAGALAGCALDDGDDGGGDDSAVDAVAVTFPATTCAVFYSKDAYFGDREIIADTAPDGELTRKANSVAVKPGCTMNYKYRKSVIDFFGTTIAYTSSNPSIPGSYVVNGSYSCACAADEVKLAPQVATLSGYLSTGYVPLWPDAPVPLGTSATYLTQVSYAEGTHLITLIEDNFEQAGSSATNASTVVSGTTAKPAQVARAVRSKLSQQTKLVALATGPAATTTCP